MDKIISVEQKRFESGKGKSLPFFGTSGENKEVNKNLSISELKKLTAKELIKMAEKLGMENPSRIRGQSISLSDGRQEMLSSLRK